MGKRGAKPKGKVKLKWSANFAYAVGLIVSDGCLYSDGRHINLVSKDTEQIENFLRCLKITSRISQHDSGSGKINWRVQIGDVNFYQFLESIGVTSAKSKTLATIDIPSDFFFDFLRGSFDGDGCFFSYWDKRWKSSHMFYVEFVSASEKHIVWLREQIHTRVGVKGHITGGKKNGSIFQLKYAKREALEIIDKMYYTPRVTCLSRKKLKIQKALKIESKQQKTYLTK
jgi:intein-encoded DNA endonuclease-like protein